MDHVDWTKHLGRLVRDQVSGLEGVAVAVNEWVGGSVLIGIKGALVEGKMVRLEYVSAEQVVVVGGSRACECTPPRDPKPLPFGVAAQDMVSRLEGIVVSRCTFLSGCVRYGIQAPAADGKVPPVAYADAGLVDRCGDGLTDLLNEGPGGPSTDDPGSQPGGML